MQEDPKQCRIWEVIKGLVGNDLLDAPLPIGQYCPFTTLHFRCAELEYTRLLDQVASPLCQSLSSCSHCSIRCPLADFEHSWLPLTGLSIPRRSLHLTLHLAAWPHSLVCGLLLVLSQA